MLSISFFIILVLFTGISLVFYSIAKNDKLFLSSETIRNSILYLWLFFISIFVLNCINFVKPGEVGVVVNLLGEDKGIEKKELTLGAHFILPWKDLYKFPIYEQNHQWVGEECFSFQTYEDLPVTADIGITFNLDPSRVHDLFYKYRRGMEEITHLFVKNIIRDAINKIASKMRIEDLYGSQKEEFFNNVHYGVNKELSQLGINVSHIFIIGKFGVPELVMDALNKKIEATQKAQQRENELREAEAQAKKEIAIAQGIAQSKIISAKSEAEANTMIINSLNSDLIKWEAIKKWNGQLPNALGGEGTSFLIDLKK